MLRQNVIDKWHELNHRLNAINRTLTEIHGGPDIRESDDPDRFRNRQLVAAELKGLETAMTEEEFNEVNPE